MSLVPEVSVTESERSSFRFGFGAGLGALTAYALAQAIVTVRQVLILLLVSAFLAVGLDPAVTWLARHLRRGLAVAIVAAAVLGSVGGFVAAAAPPVSRQATQLVHDVPNYVKQLQQNKTIRDFDARYHVLDKIKAQAEKGTTFGLDAVGGVIGFGKALLGALASALTVLILTLYLLGNLESIKQTALRLAPRSTRDHTRDIVDEILSKIGGYVLGNLATSVVAGVAALIVLEIVGSPSPVALALFVAFMDLVPLIGASIAALVVTLIVGLSVSWLAALMTFALFLAYQQFENYVLVPRVMRRAVDVSPLATIVAALIGAGLLGILGALLAIPFAAAVQIISRELVVPRQETL